jgi:hypothetical protein
MRNLLATAFVLATLAGSAQAMPLAPAASTGRAIAYG